MKLRILLLVLISYTLQAMEQPPRQKRPASETVEALQGEPKTQRGEPEVVSQQMPAFGPQPTFMGIPQTTREQIFSYLVTARGATQEKKLFNAAENIRNFLMIKQFKPWLEDVNLAGEIITELAKRYSNNDVVRAAEALSTNAASKWLAEQVKSKAKFIPAKPISKSTLDPKTEADTQFLVDLQNALFNAVDRIDIGAVRFFLTYQPHLVNAVRNNDDLSMLFNAVATGDTQLVNLLLKNGADPNFISADPEGETSVIQKAAMGNNVEILKALQSAGADITQLDEFDGNLLGHAGSPEIVSYLAEQGLDVNHRDQDDETPLTNSIARLNRADVVKALLDVGADPNLINKNGFTPLHLAIDKNNPEIINILLDNGADIAKTDHEGNTPLAVAIKESKKEAAKVLRERGATQE